MLSHIYIKNFKRFGDVDFELGQSVVLIGPNNSGKTTALQALALWDTGLRQWLANPELRMRDPRKRDSTDPRPRAARSRPLAINRNELISIPVSSVDLLWHDLRLDERVSGSSAIRIGITVDGVTDGEVWSCGFEFQFANEESFYCYPLRSPNGGKSAKEVIPAAAASVQVAFLPPMSGLATVEPKLESGRINVLLGEGQTAQVLRNLCYQIYSQDEPEDWQELSSYIEQLFGVALLPPQHIQHRGEIHMRYKEKEHGDAELDLAASGRGLQQTLLLFAYLYANPQTVLLLDEPDAHLEILRQRQIYSLLTEIARNKGSQIIAASHSEVILNEAADRDIVIAFVGPPHRIDDRGSQVLKALKEIGFEQYYQAEQRGWVLYLEGPTDLAILQAFAGTLGHRATHYLERPFVHYVGNVPPQARNHFYGLREAKADLQGIAIFDRLERGPLASPYPQLIELMWQRRELENYLTLEDVLLAYARGEQTTDPLSQAEANRREQAMNTAIAEVSAALKTLRRPDPWSSDIKASDEFLDPLFEAYFNKLGLPNLMRKTDYHTLARLVPKEQLDPEINEKLDRIVEVAQRANPRRG